LPDENKFRDLIQRVRQRDEEAAAELVQSYESAIRRVVRIHLRDSRLRRVLDSMDICQSVLASFFVRTALGEFELESPQQLLQLLATITRNKLVNQANRLRAQRRDIRRDAALDADSGHLLVQKLGLYHSAGAASPGMNRQWAAASGMMPTSCIWIAPYGHDSPQRPQPMHQSSMTISPTGPR